MLGVAVSRAACGPCSVVGCVESAAVSYSTLVSRVCLEKLYVCDRILTRETETSIYVAHMHKLTVMARACVFQVWVVGPVTRVVHHSVASSNAAARFCALVGVPLAARSVLSCLSCAETKCEREDARRTHRAVGRWRRLRP